MGNEGTSKEKPEPTPADGVTICDGVVLHDDGGVEVDGNTYYCPGNYLPLIKEKLANKPASRPDDAAHEDYARDVQKELDDYNASTDPDPNDLADEEGEASMTFEQVHARSAEEVKAAKRRGSCSIYKFLAGQGNEWMHGTSCPECGSGPTNDMATFLYAQIKKVMENPSLMVEGKSVLMAQPDENSTPDFTDFAILEPTTDDVHKAEDCDDCESRDLQFDPEGPCMGKEMCIVKDGHKTHFKRRKPGTVLTGDDAIAAIDDAFKELIDKKQNGEPDQKRDEKKS